MSTLSQFAGGGLKSVQRGVTTLSTIGTATNVTITSVNLSKSFICLSVKDGLDTSGVTRLAGATLTSSTNLQFNPTYTGNAAAVAYWEVVEFY